jgi:hypothetical protein
MKSDSVKGALRLAISALRGALGLVLVRMARKMIDGAVTSPADEVPTAPIRPPLD